MNGQNVEKMILLISLQNISIRRPENPEKPSNPETPSNPENPSKPADKSSTTKPADLGKGTGTVQNTSTTAQSNTVKTGDEAPIVPYTAVAGISLLGIVTALFKRKKEDK